MFFPVQRGKLPGRIQFSMDPQNILVRMPNWLGDLVMATPVLSCLREKYRDARLTVMCPHGLVEAFAADPRVEEVFGFSKRREWFSRRQERKDCIESLRRGKYDLGILLPHSFSSAWLFFQGHVQERVGYAGHFRRFLLTKSVASPKEPMHQVELYQHLLGRNPPYIAPKLFVDAEQQKSVREKLRQRGIEGKWIAVHPGAAFGPAKCWPKERFRKLLEKCQEVCPVVVVGDGGQKQEARSLVEGLSSSIISLAGETSLGELIALLSLSSLLVTNDSGPMHVAAAVSTPLVAIFGSTDPSRTGPYGVATGVLYAKAPCSPCFRRECPIDFRCMKEISVEEVFSRVQAHV